MMSGPLTGTRVIEVAGIGPCPFAAMMLSDMGAEVIRIERVEAVSAGGGETYGADLLNRGRRSLGIDLKHPDGVAAFLRLVEQADVLIEGFRPGVMDRLGLGPGDCTARNPRLVYGRMTGWGQDGPYAMTAGHDINYLAVSGILAAIGRHGQPPTPPLNLVGDFGGGGMLLAFGVACALLERQVSGAGQVVDAAMIDGASVLSTVIHSQLAAGRWEEQRGVNLLDSGAPFYDAYECSDGRYVALGAIEPKFYAKFASASGLAVQPGLPAQYDRESWPELRRRISALFKTRSRDEWCALLGGDDTCLTPVLGLSEAPAHPHNTARATFVAADGVVQPAPAPRFSRTPGAIQHPPVRPGENTGPVLLRWGFAEFEILRLRAAGAIA
jgi:alpha-methylacyl-CoA racemase